MHAWAGGVACVFKCLQKLHDWGKWWKCHYYRMKFECNHLHVLGHTNGVEVLLSQCIFEYLLRQRSRELHPGYPSIHHSYLQSNQKSALREGITTIYQLAFYQLEFSISSLAFAVCCHSSETRTQYCTVCTMLMVYYAQWHCQALVAVLMPCPCWWPGRSDWGPPSMFSFKGLRGKSHSIEHEVWNEWQ